MKCTWQVFGVYTVAAAATVCGCATPSVSNAPAGLPAQQLHNVARPAEKKSWLPKMMQPTEAKTKAGTNNSTSLGGIETSNQSSKGKPSKPIDPLTLARLHERRGQTEQAVRMYEAELHKQPKNAKIHHRLAVIAARAGQWEKADDHFRAATALDPTNAELLCDCGYALYLQHQLPEAESCLRAAVEANPNHKAAFNNLGLVLGVQGKYEESLAAFRQGGSEAEAHANLGYVHMQLGDVDGAMAELNHALSLDSKLRNAALALIQLNDIKHRFQPKQAAGAEQIAQQTPQVVDEAVIEGTNPFQASGAPAIEIAAAPVTREGEVPTSEPFATELADDEPIDGSLTEYRFRMVRRQEAPALSQRQFGAESSAASQDTHALRPVTEPVNAAARSQESDESGNVVQASAQLTPGQNISVRTLTSAPQVNPFPVRVHTPSARLQQVRTADRTAERPHHSQPGLGPNLDGRSPLQVTTEAMSNAASYEGLQTAVSGAQAAGAAGAVVRPMTGDAPALVPQIRMPRPEELIPQQSHISQLPTHQLHPTASATWSAPQTPRPSNDATGVPSIAPIRNLP